MGALNFVIYDVVGKQIKKISNVNKNGLKLERGNLVSGMYFYQLTETDKILSSGKLIVQ